MDIGGRGLRNIMSPRTAFHENGQSVHKKRSQKRRHYKELWVESIMPEVINYKKWNLYVERVLEGRTPKEVMKYESMRHIGRPQKRLSQIRRRSRGGKIRNEVRFMASTSCYRDSFTFYINLAIILPFKIRR
jgi:hypothetical protein